MKQVRGERWVLRTGRNAIRHSYAPILYILLAVLFAGLGLWAVIGRLDGGLEAVTSAFTLPLIYFILAFMWVFNALISYERREFYKIIMEQESRIAELEGLVRQQQQMPPSDL